MDNAISPDCFDPQIFISTVVGLVEGLAIISCCVVPVAVPDSRNDWLKAVVSHDDADTPLRSPSSAQEAMEPTVPVPSAACSMRVSRRRDPLSIDWAPVLTASLSVGSASFKVMLSAESSPNADTVALYTESKAA